MWNSYMCMNIFHIDVSWAVRKCSQIANMPLVSENADSASVAIIVPSNLRSQQKLHQHHCIDLITWFWSINLVSTGLDLLELLPSFDNSKPRTVRAFENLCCFLDWIWSVTIGNVSIERQSKFMFGIIRDVYLFQQAHFVSKSIKALIIMLFQGFHICEFSSLQTVSMCLFFLFFFCVVFRWRLAYKARDLSSNTLQE